MGKTLKDLETEAAWHLARADRTTEDGADHYRAYRYVMDSIAAEYGDAHYGLVSRRLEAVPS